MKFKKNGPEGDIKELFSLIEASKSNSNLKIYQKYFESFLHHNIHYFISKPFQHTKQEALKRPMKQKRKLRIFISNTAFPANEAPGATATPTPPAEPGAAPPPTEGSATTCWELRVEGRLIDEDKKVC